MPPAERGRATSSCKRGVVRPELEHRAEHGDALTPLPGMRRAARCAARAEPGFALYASLINVAEPICSQFTRIGGAGIAAIPRAASSSGYAQLARDGERQHRVSEIVRAAQRKPHVDRHRPEPAAPSGVDRPLRRRARSPASRPATTTRVARALRAASTTSGCDAGTIATATPSPPPSPRAARRRGRQALRDAPRRRTSRRRCRARRSRAARRLRPDDSSPSRRRRRRLRPESRAASAERRRVVQVSAVAWTVERAAERGSNQFFRARLSVACRRRRPRFAPRAATIAAERAERDERVAHLEHRNAEIAAPRRARHDDAAAPSPRRRQENRARRIARPRARRTGRPCSIVRVSVHTRPNVRRSTRQIDRRERSRAHRRRDRASRTLSARPAAVGGAHRDSRRASALARARRR